MEYFEEIYEQRRNRNAQILADRKRALRVHLALLLTGAVLIGGAGIGAVGYLTGTPMSAAPAMTASNAAREASAAEETPSSKSFPEATLPAGNRFETEAAKDGSSSSGAKLPTGFGGELTGEPKEDVLTSLYRLSEERLKTLLSEAETLAAGYDYDAAIELLRSDSRFSSNSEVNAAIASYEETKSTLVRADISKITHVFFHSLIMDNSKAFDGDADQDGYNQVMTTKSEFLKILQSMYDRGYVLVRLHDMAYETVDENGNTVMTEGDILLPPGKKPFVMSQDDVCYYDYMEGDGFAARMVVGEDGKPTCEMTLEDGSVVTGSYDLVPLLEDFIAEHPDFSYKGARAVIAFTGYQGILGYRTDPDYADTNPNYESDKEEVKKVVQSLRDNGWELASHTYGHMRLSDRSLEDIETDTAKWDAYVTPLLGDIDILLFPYGADIGDWHPYTTDNEKFNFLYAHGFRYFCNVDSSEYWVQLGTTFLRQGRRNLDGVRMYYDLPETNPTKDHLSDLFDVSEVFDRERPTPVPEM